MERVYVQGFIATLFVIEKEILEYPKCQWVEDWLNYGSSI